MPITLTLDSNTNPDVISGLYKSSDFVTAFAPPVVLGKDQYEIALIKLNLWYSWYNISAAKNNNTLRYNNGAVWRANIIIPDGQYTIDGIEAIVHQAMRDNGDMVVDAFNVEQPDITITPNFATLRVRITLNNGFLVDLTLSDLYLLLGFDSVVVNATGDGPQVANINDSINTLVAHCDAVDSSFSYANTGTSDILHVFVPHTIPGTNIDVDPQHKSFMNIDNVAQIDRMRVYITDNLGRPIDMNLEPVTWTLQLRKVVD